jgi:hypothetical protein
MWASQHIEWDGEELSLVEGHEPSPVGQKVGNSGAGMLAETRIVFKNYES